jgi:hypothetical protein
MSQRFPQIPIPPPVAPAPPPGGWLTQPPRKLSPMDYLLFRAQQLKDTKYKGIPQDFSFSEGNPPLTINLPPQFLAAYPDEWPGWVANPLDRNNRKSIRLRYNEWLKDYKDKAEKESNDYNEYVVEYEALMAQVHAQATQRQLIQQQHQMQVEQSLAAQKANIEARQAEQQRLLKQHEEQTIRMQLLAEIQKSEQNLEIKKTAMMSEKAAFAAAAITATTSTGGSKKQQQQQQQQSKPSLWTSFKANPAPVKPADKELLPQKRLDALVKDVLGDTLKCAPEAERALKSIAEDFVSCAFQFGATIARRRQDKKMSAGDLATYFRRYWNLEVPGTMTEGQKYKRLRFGEEHKARLAAIREATLTGGGEQGDGGGGGETGGGGVGGNLVEHVGAAGAGGVKKGVKRKAGGGGGGEQQDDDDDDNGDTNATKRRR